MKRYIKTAEGLTARQRASIAKKSTDTKELRRLSYDNADSVKLEVLKNPKTPEDVVNRLSKEFMDSDDSSIRRFIATYVNDPDMLSKLANDEDKIVRCYVAENPNTDADVLAQLADDKNWFVRQYVAENPSTDSDTLSQLAVDEDRFVRSSVAKNQNTDSETLAQLATDDVDAVRNAAQSNNNYDPSILKIEE